MAAIIAAGLPCPGCPRRPGRRAAQGPVTTIPGLPESKRLDVEAQLEHSALGTASAMACDTNVMVACDPEGDCTASYGDEKIVLDVIRGGCNTWAIINERSCEYRMEAANRFLTQRNVNS